MPIIFTIYPALHRFLFNQMFNAMMDKSFRMSTFDFNRKYVKTDFGVIEGKFISDGAKTT